MWSAPVLSDNEAATALCRLFLPIEAVCVLFVFLAGSLVRPGGIGREHHHAIRDAMLGKETFPCRITRGLVVIDRCGEAGRAWRLHIRAVVASFIGMQVESGIFTVLIGPATAAITIACVLRYLAISTVVVRAHV